MALRVVTLNMQASPSTLSCAGLTAVPLTPSDANHISLAEENAISSVSYPAGKFSNSELRMHNTGESHEY